MNLTKNFTRQEFACHCNCGFDTVDFALVTALQDLRDHFELVVNVSSGCRCIRQNDKIPTASRNSNHLIGKAADVQIAGVEPHTIYDYLCIMYPGKYGIKQYKTWVHLDVRDREWREVVV